MNLLMLDAFILGGSLVVVNRLLDRMMQRFSTVEAQSQILNVLDHLTLLLGLSWRVVAPHLDDDQPMDLDGYRVTVALFHPPDPCPDHNLRGKVNDYRTVRAFFNTTAHANTNPGRFRT